MSEGQGEGFRNKTVNLQNHRSGIMTNMANEQYEQSILKWRQEVDANLRRENGWLALSGLFWLRNGTNVIGSDPNSDILLPARAARRLGTFEFDGNNVTMNVEDRTPVE